MLLKIYKKHYQYYKENGLGFYEFITALREKNKADGSHAHIESPFRFIFY